MRRSDPSVVHHTDGLYYLVCTYDYGSYSSLKIRAGSKINSLRYKDEYTVNFTNASEMGAYSYFWGPELKFINAQWYLFFTASVSSTSTWLQRPFVAKCTGTSPLTSDFEILGKIQAVTQSTFDESQNIIDSYSMGPNVFYSDGQWYFAWTQNIEDGDEDWDLDGETGIDNNNLTLKIGENSDGTLLTKDFEDLAQNIKNKNTWQCLFIGKTSPEDFTKVTNATIISVPEYDWECGTYTSHSDTDFGNINDAPSFIIKDSQIYCIYSASDTDESYCMGLLSAKVGSELCNYSSWHKSPESIFSTNSTFNAYGPGSASFTTDGENTVMFYSARNYSGLYSSGTTTTKESYSDLNRAVCAKQIGWNTDGTPNLYYK